VLTSLRKGIDKIMEEESERILSLGLEELREAESKRKQRILQMFDTTETNRTSETVSNTAEQRLKALEKIAVQIKRYIE
jgi:hypothetical protein